MHTVLQMLSLGLLQELAYFGFPFCHLLLLKQFADLRRSAFLCQFLLDQIQISLTVPSSRSCLVCAQAATFPGCVLVTTLKSKFG